MRLFQFRSQLELMRILVFVLCGILVVNVKMVQAQSLCKTCYTVLPLPIADGIDVVTLSVSHSNRNSAPLQSSGTIALPVKIHFDDLLNHTVVTDQYLGPVGVRFSSNNVFFPPVTFQDCGFCLLPLSQIS